MMKWSVAQGYRVDWWPTSPPKRNASQRAMRGEQRHSSQDGWS